MFENDPDPTILADLYNIGTNNFNAVLGPGFGKVGANQATMAIAEFGPKSELASNFLSATQLATYWAYTSAVPRHDRRVYIHKQADRNVQDNYFLEKATPLK